jgi:hypothetical protein
MGVGQNASIERERIVDEPPSDRVATLLPQRLAAPRSGAALDCKWLNSATRNTADVPWLG